MKVWIFYKYCQRIQVQVCIYQLPLLWHFINVITFLGFINICVLVKFDIQGIELCLLQAGLLLIYIHPVLARPDSCSQNIQDLVKSNWLTILIFLINTRFMDHITLKLFKPYGICLSPPLFSPFLSIVRVDECIS